MKHGIYAASSAALLLYLLPVTASAGSAGQQGVGQPSSHIKPGSLQSQVSGDNANPQVSGDANQTRAIETQPENAQGKPLTTVNGTITDALAHTTITL